jgi:hypothetical protein
MRLYRGLWAGACLLLALAGCSKKSDTIEGSGSFSPILTGISSSNEPAARGAPNVLTAQVTNINSLPLTYHWSVAPNAGVITDTTSASATWTPPDAIGLYDVTVSIEAQDGDTHYFKTLTVHMNVDNQYVRWTRSNAIQFQPAPSSGGGVFYAEYRDPVAGTSDIYRLDAPLASPLPMVTGFYSVDSPTPRADQVDFAFMGRIQQSDAFPSLYLLPFGGGDAATARFVTGKNVAQTILRHPRFAPVGTRLLYVSDTTFTGTGHPVWRDAANFNSSPVVGVFTEEGSSTRFNDYLRPAWGGDNNGDGNPDSLISPIGDSFGGVAGFAKLETPDTGRVYTDLPWLTDPAIDDPDWSSDGNHIIFTRKNPGTNEHDIWIINSHITNPTLSDAVRVTSGPADDTHPRFNSDGTKIFFISNRVDQYGVNGIFQTERRGTNVWSVAHFDKP